MANYHGPLYDRACSVFQRRVKQVYFQLNPFLERTCVKDDEAEAYQPSSKFVIPLKSIVVCEQFDSDQAKDWKVLNPDEFWDYLYSESWDDDSSLRVLEGELLVLLNMLLCVLEKNEDVTCHNTFAYSKNKRRVNKCYTKSSDTNPEFTDETFLIEFIYYGISVRMKTEQKKNDFIVSWKDYKELASKAAGLSKLVDIVDLVGNKCKKPKKGGGFMSLIRSPKSVTAHESNDTRLEALTALRWQDNLRAMNTSRQRSGMFRSKVNGPMFASSTDHDGNLSPLDNLNSTATDNGTELLARMDEILFDKQKVNRWKRNNTFFGGLLGRRQPPGDEFYINQLTSKHREPFLASQLLNERKTAKMVEREQEIQEAKQLSEAMRNSQFKDYMAEVGENMYDSHKPLLKVYDRRASFGEFYKYLEQENKFDPRFKKGSQRKKKLVDSKKPKEKNPSKMSVIGASKRNLKLNRSSVLSVSGKNSTVGGMGVEEDKKIGSSGYAKKSVTDRQRFANEVNGVTDSKAAKRHCLQNVLSGTKVVEELSKGSIQFRGRRTNSMFSDNVPSCSHRVGDNNFYSVLPKITSPILERVSRPISPSGKTFTTPGHSRVGTKTTYTSKRSSTLESCSDTESSDSTIYDEEDDFHDTVFNTNKLNRKYSIEKIRAIKSKKEKKPPVINILRKFCRVNRMMNSLAPATSAKASRKSISEANPRKSLADTNKAKQTAKAFGMFRRLNKKAIPEVQQEFEIGKIKQFGFLKHKDHKMIIPEVILPTFKTCSIDDFRRNLLRAMDDFVIRKEMVTSSYTYETVTTVTFTKPAAYIRMYQIPRDP